MYCLFSWHDFSQTSGFFRVQLNFWQFFPRIQNMRNMKRKQVTDQRREKSIIYYLDWYFCSKMKWKRILSPKILLKIKAYINGNDKSSLF